ncbi:MAG TPA: efflux RND transporter periplasmic adaptor subunit [Noviherbaspirillum sp.]|uniref:efflux RND transporter periplasmic adaptor subunit n=1 Tax=Noviherbaspirillum sp. TaxID=1926288 RepID=UPI002B49E274|nr:efflux RND transporter periplasmic adaptor subunit [Noviherbaspirillum sp.]HJV85340.1 efflux RND transporter periplasmic adaptor subunit [Noviherbaspirillum sp.]
MKQHASIILGTLIVAALAGAGGYWAGTHGKGEAAAAVQATSTDNGGKKERKLLYYRNPMGLPDTSPVPKKDPMGMDYIPVYEGEDDAEPASANQVKISTDKVQKLGVRTEAASMKSIDRTVRAAGRIEADERRLYAISPKFEGYVERLHVNATGQAVAKGQPLFEVYSPELVSAQREYAVAAQGVQALKGADSEAQQSMKQLAESSLLRLKNWDISEEQVKALAKSGQAKHSMTFRSPANGIVTERKAVAGMRFMPGEMLYQIADLSTVWVLADVYEQDIAFVKSGAKAKVRINAYPDKVFEGPVSYVYPTLNAGTRTVQVRIELANPGQLLKPGMFSDVEMAASSKSNVLTVPLSAVIDSGKRRIVLVQAGEGKFEPREVRLGARSDDYIEVLEGVKEGEQVVVAANFLIDAESNLKAAVGGFGSTEKSEAPAAQKAVVGHKAEGKVEEIDAKGGTISITHGPIASLKWPGMTMEFNLANEVLVKGLKPGATVAFEFVERQPGEWVITSITPKDAGAGNIQAHAGHEGHEGH